MQIVIAQYFYQVVRKHSLHEVIDFPYIRTDQTDCNGEKLLKLVNT